MSSEASALTDEELPARDPAVPAEAQGLFRKFNVRRTDGGDEPGRKHHGCEYFVLDVTHDQYAPAALAAYAMACKPTHPELSADMMTRYRLAAAKLSGGAGEPGCYKLDTASQVFFYEQDFYVLSNFSSFSIMWEKSPRDGLVRFDTSEAVYHWMKFSPCIPTLEQRRIREEIRNAPSAHEAFKIAERNKGLRRHDWDDVKVDIMRDILRAKADQHEYVRRKLLATGDRELIEDSWRDTYWGWGPNRDGQNMLGRLWMEVRAELRDAATPPVEPAVLDGGIDGPYNEPAPVADEIEQVNREAIEKRQRDLARRDAPVADDLVERLGWKHGRLSQGTDISGRDKILAIYNLMRGYQEQKRRALAAEARITDLQAEVGALKGVVGRAYNPDTMSDADCAVALPIYLAALNAGERDAQG